MNWIFWLLPKIFLNFIIFIYPIILKFSRSTAELYTRRPSSTRLPRFAGKPNAFVIELFALRDDMDPRLGFDFLLAAFEVFPELEFGILTVPSEYPPFPFLDHFTVIHNYKSLQY